MPITIETPTAEAIFSAARYLSEEEKCKLRLLLQSDALTADPTYSGEWSEEDLRHLDRHTARLIDERFGPEEGNYD